MQTFRMIIIAATVAISVGGFWFAYQSGIFGPQSSQVLQGNNAPKIGGHFTLTDQDGKTRTEKDFNGTYLLIYFGYTYCPDVCPVTLTKISTAYDKLGDDAKKITPLFITVDPKRDTPEQLHEYTKYFNPAIIGLTGTDEQIAAAAKEYRIYYAKAPSNDGDPDDYTMDHSSVVYLMTPDNKFATSFSHTATADDMAKGIRKVIDGN